jgi:peptidoglycan/LPS O-acetylase OafA/YrhL
LFKAQRRSTFLLGTALGVAIWLLSPFVTGHREPWDAEGGYYFTALLLAGVLGGLVLPEYWGSLVIGIFAGQAAVLLGGVVAEPASGGLWPLGLVFLAFYSVLGLVGAAIGMGLRRFRSRREGSRAG